MPQRTNPFQQLATRIEQAMHGQGATIAESAMVYNAVSEKAEEIDVLISFSQGGRTYRTGVAVRDWARKAGPGWIRDLGQQRLDCGLDKMVAVHSLGFTPAAKKTAAARSVELMTLSQASDADWATISGVRTVMTASAWVNQRSGMWFKLRDFPVCPRMVEDAWTIRIPGVDDLTYAQFRSTLFEMVQGWTMRGIDPPAGPKPKLPEERSFVRFVRYSASLPSGTTLIAPNGDQFVIVEVGGEAPVRLEAKRANSLDHYTLNGVPVLDGKLTFFGMDATAVFLEKDGKHHAHLEPTHPGLTIGRVSFAGLMQAERESLPIPLKVSWCVPSAPEPAPAIVPTKARVRQ